MAPQPSLGYLRSPSIGGDTVVFVTEDDLWSVPAQGGRARRLTADLLRIAAPVISPDARTVAFTSVAQGNAEIHLVPASGGMARRLTWLGAPYRMGHGANPKALGWMADGRLRFRQRHWAALLFVDDGLRHFRRRGATAGAPSLRPGARCVLRAREVEWS